MKKFIADLPVVITRINGGAYEQITYPTDEHIIEMKKWCKANTGRDQWNYYDGWCRDHPYQFKFKQSEDLLAFKLKFGV